MPTPLNELLNAALGDLTQEFARAAGDAALSLELHANLLRHIPEEGLDIREVPAAARVSKRAVKWNVVLGQRSGWITLGGPKNTHVQLTDAGREARDASERCARLAEAAWGKRFGNEVVAHLRSSLEALVRQFDLELPHHPAGYGPADGSVTGGVAGRWGRGNALRVKGVAGHVFDPVAERDEAEAWERDSGGRLYVRETGQDWRPVPRGDGDTVSELPAFALLSQAVMAFAIDYEGCGGLSMARSGNALRYITDEGLEVALRPSRSRGLPPLMPADSTLSGLTRHAYTDVVVDPNDRRKGWLTLSEKGKAVRDAYDDIVVAIEQRWERRYGAATVRDVRRALSAVKI